MRQLKIHCVIPHFPNALRVASPLRLHWHTHIHYKLLPRPSNQLTRSFSTTQTMASDDAYMSFLDKANADVSPKSQQGGIQTQTVHSTLSVPKALQSIQIYYISETDEPFEPVALKWDEAAKGTWPSPDQLSSLIAPDSNLSISTLSPSSFDPRNQYTAALDAVREAADGSEVKIYRVELTSTKIEYWVLGLHKAESRVVGLRAKAVES
ncbi:unnamed protein product [Penicillium salamii]|uniref:Uncharacterized protein n=1 Tax=Penicillium salamii TaxID=1612424 RepID=A0A9W4K4U6_9EURO|nr:unnamed protein product [Penicillium salamii]CAG7941200.1 unnamed protein product [Penicillium salamii]CAG7955207.1 unnamed protein product [Penicillium salamii]CAG8138332.1 unnamed protein product [Penicillium salamii]CAG8189841.1 unnamed protein product [Penicillium salamii]